MNIVQHGNSLELHDDTAFHQQVCRVLANDPSIVANRNVTLLLRDEPGFSKLDHQCIFVNLLQESATKDIAYPLCATDNPLGYPIKFLSAFIGVYRRLHCFKGLAAVA